MPSAGRNSEKGPEMAAAPVRPSLMNRIVIVGVAGAMVCQLVLLIAVSGPNRRLINPGWAPAWDAA